MINNLGIDTNTWFDNPLDSMPIATNQPLDFTPFSYERKDPPAELFEVPTSVTNPKPPKKTQEEEKTPHHIAYEIATAKYNPFSVGGTEQLGGGSETIQK